MSVFTNPANSSAEETAAYTAALLDLLGTKNPIEILRKTPAALQQAAAGLTASEMARPEAPGKWSVRQVLQHLADSDLVWAFRVRMVLAHERPRLIGYDQDLWAERLGYADANPEKSLQDFTVLRQSNLRLLDRASPEDLRRVGLHSERGEESIQHMIRLYAAHDLLHLQQLARIRKAISRDE